MKDKFAINLIWHNCKTYPPDEKWNDNLYITDGEYVFDAEYDWQRGWYNKYAGDYIPFGELSDWWWADIEQTVQTSKEFYEIRGRNYGQERI